MKVVLWPAVAVILVSASSTAVLAEARTNVPLQIEELVRPYVATRNFSGVILAARDGKLVYEKAYGFADFAKRVPNTTKTRFHVASMSMQYTAAAVLRLAMAKRLSLDTPILNYVPDLPNADRITIRHLLTQTSGIRDINGLADYDSVLEQHQTPQSLVDKVRRLPAEREPGKFEGEEHSAFNLLALIIERETRLPFAQAVKTLVFDPLGMDNSGIDDDGPRARHNAALGHAPVGVREVEPAKAIHWSGKAGNASAFTMASDQLRFVQAMTSSDFLSADLRAMVFDLSQRVGYGWFKSDSKRFGQPVYSMNGRAPGFASAMVYIPRERVFVVALSNLYASFAPDIATETAAAILGRPYEELRLASEIDPKSLNGLPASFKFGQDFYQENATVRLFTKDGEVFLEWPSGDRSPLIPVSADHYVDRAYGVPVEVVRSSSDSLQALKYDRFTGSFVSTGGK